MAYPAQSKDSNNIPIGSPYVPGSPGVFYALKGSPNTNTDGSGNTSTAGTMALDQAIVLSAQLQNAQAGNANGSTLTLNGMGAVLFEVIQTGFTGTVNFEGAGPNANYDPLSVVQLGTTTIATTVVGSTTTATHLYELSNASGLQTVRARTSGVSAGTVTVNAYAQPAPVGTRVVNTVQAGTWTVQPGNTPNTSAWLVSRVGSNITVLASGARTTTQTSADLTNTDGRGVKVVLDVTAVSSGSITLTIKGKDVASGKYYSILAGVAVTTVSTTVYTVYPGLTAAANSVASDVVPPTFQILVTANNSNSITYSVGVATLL